MKRAQSTGMIAAIWAISLIAPLSLAGQGAAGRLQSAGQSVALVARMPETASVAGMVSPVPQELLQDGQTAETVLLQESWTFASGQTVAAECQVMTEPGAIAELLSSKSRYLANSFLSTASPSRTSQVQTFPLIIGFDPAKGSLSDTQILLIVHDSPGETSSASVRITVVAL